MPLSGDEKKKYMKEYHAAKKTKEQRAAELEFNRDKIREFDATGATMLAESRSLTDLQKVYFGNGLQDDEESTKKSTKKKESPCNPSSKPILGQELSFINWADPTDESTWIGLRNKARADLFWFGREVLKKDLEPVTHQIVCDQFVKKNFVGMYKLGYTLGDVHKAIKKQGRFDVEGNATREMMLLDPRGFFKSTIDGLDATQWLINCPDIRILILTGEFKLAVAFLSEIKGYFFQPENSDATDFHLLFPEYVLRGVDGTSEQPLECPARKHIQKEPSVWVNAIVANLSGWHCDIKKGDDIVTDENSNTKQAREKLKKKYDGTRNLLDEWGLADHIGTRYFPDDWYGTRIDIMGKGKGKVPLKYFCRQCWEVKPGFAEIELKDLTEDMVILNFPEKATWESLQEKLNEDIIGFRCQQLNEPAGDDNDGWKIAFTEDALRKNVYQISASPQIGDIVTVWDTALTHGKQSDFSVGVAARIVELEPGKKGLSVLEIVCDKWRQTELAFQVVMFTKKWMPKHTLIETLAGSELLQREIQTQAGYYGVNLNIWWKPPSNQADAKKNRVKGLETLLSNGLLKFVSGPWIDETFKQLCRYTGERKNRGRKDDIPDALGYLAFFLPANSTSGAVDTEEVKAMAEEARKQALMKAHYERIFGGEPVNLEPQPLIDVEPSNRGMFGIPGLRG